MPEYEPNGCCVGIQPEGCILLANPIEGEVTRELILLQDFKQDFLLQTIDSSAWDESSIPGSQLEI
jgi:hypothetical protein